MNWTFWKSSNNAFSMNLPSSFTIGTSPSPKFLYELSSENCATFLRYIISNCKESLPSSTFISSFISFKSIVTFNLQPMEILKKTRTLKTENFQYASHFIIIECFCSVRKKYFKIPWVVGRAVQSGKGTKGTNSYGLSIL